MAKLAFTKLGLVKNQDIQTVEWNGQNIEIKQYIPVNDKLALISNVLNESADDNNFANPVKIEIFTALEIINFYTNITFTDKQKEDPCKLFDLLTGSGLYKEIINKMNEDEYNTLVDYIQDCIDAVYIYKNSVMGILEAVSADYSNLDLDATEIQSKIADKDNLTLLKDVLTKLG